MQTHSVRTFIHDARCPADRHRAQMLHPAAFRGRFNSKRHEIIMITCTFLTVTRTKRIPGPRHTCCRLLIVSQTGPRGAASKGPGSKSNEFLWLNWNYAQLHKSPGAFYYAAPDHLAPFSPSVSWHVYVSVRYS